MDALVSFIGLPEREKGEDLSDLPPVLAVASEWEDWVAALQSGSAAAVVVPRNEVPAAALPAASDEPLTALFDERYVLLTPSTLQEVMGRE